jgi:hypothetical protein
MTQRACCTLNAAVLWRMVHISVPRALMKRFLSMLSEYVLAVRAPYAQLMHDSSQVLTGPIRAC